MTIPVSTTSDYVVDFHTMWIVPAWIRQHCVIPDSFDAGNPYIPSDWQDWYYLNFYRVKSRAPLPTGNKTGIGAPAFYYRRAQVVMPQKALSLDTAIVTPSGWTTIGDLAVGDEVFDRNGLVTRVLSKSQIWETDSYCVTFSDGAELVACGDHEWIVERRTKTTLAKDRRALNVEERLSTRDIIKRGVTEGAAKFKRFRVRNARPLILPDSELPISPYTLGAWLGDGCNHDARITGLDLEVFQNIESDGFVIKQDPKIAKRWQVYGLHKILRENDLLCNKHIPDAYLRASEQQRWALLQGLMDTDGSADARQGKCEFSTTTPALRDGVMELLHSLGIRNACYEGEARLNGRVTGPKWRIAFSARNDMPIFRIERKQIRLRSSEGSHAQFKHRRIVSIEQVETVKTQCITVGSDTHSFLAGREMIPTGNSGKGPMTAAHVCVEAVGPALFAGWANDGDSYRCSDFGCHCGWVYEYQKGEPMGVPWPTPLIQITAYSNEQTANVYDALRPMIERGPLSAVIPKTGEDFIRLPGGGRIDTVTSSARSRLGQRVTFVPQDETGIWYATNRMIDVANTQRRGVSGMQGRSAETTNAWDPSENSVAQKTYEASLRVRDIFRLHRLAPVGLSFRDKRERRKILKFVYSGSHWVDLDSIDAEAVEIMLTDPAQAERFYGNRIIAGLGQWMDEEDWDGSFSDTSVPLGASVAVGFDGSESDDWTAIRCVSMDGHHFTPRYGPSNRPTYWNPSEWGGSIPRGEVHAAVDAIATKYRIRRMYADPRDWESEIGDWSLKYGDEVVFEWHTYRIMQMHHALVQNYNDYKSKRSTHDNCPMTREHVINARRVAKPSDRYILGKPNQHRKIDLAMADTLAHVAAQDLSVEKKWGEPARLTRVKGRVAAC